MPECNEWGILPSWVYPGQYSDNIPLAPEEVRAGFDDDVVVLPREPTSTGQRKRILTLAEQECRRESAPLDGGSPSRPTHRSLYDDDDAEAHLPLSCRRWAPVAQTPLGASTTIGPATGVSSTSGSTSQVDPAPGPFLGQGRWSFVMGLLR
jgi:hypothetical protein